MSSQTQEWLNKNILVGMTDERGHAWHRQNGGENSFSGPIPIERVRTLLDQYAAEDVALTKATDGSLIPGFKAIARKDNGHVYKIFSSGYQIHDYSAWLVDSVGDLMDSVTEDLVIANAGGLDGGAVAFVQMQLPETFKAAMGVEFRTNLTAISSLNGKFKTKYKLINQNIVCDNTLTMGLSEDSLSAGFKHTAKSLGNIERLRDKLAIGFITEAADRFAAEVEALGAIKVDDKQWSDFLALHVEITDETKGATLTRREHEREDLNQIYNFDEMAAPWKGTGYGMYQATNTYNHWRSMVRGAEREERNYLNAIGKQTENADREIIEQIYAVTK